MQVIERPPFAPVLMESTRAIGYSVESAVADIIDNSIAASAGRVELFFFPINAYICILDDGVGMNEAQLNVAMQYGSRSPIESRESSDLGRYGLGLKTASLSQCRKLTVISKQNDHIAGRCWDLDYVSQTGRWSLIVLEEDEINKLPHIVDLKKLKTGTLVIWQNLDRLFIGETEHAVALSRKMIEVRNHLELVFHRYLKGEKGIKKLVIQFNGDSLLPADPFLANKSTQVMDDEVLLVGGKKIVVKPFILPHISQMTIAERTMLGGEDGIKRQQGFYIYRNKRLVVWGTWFRMMRQGDMSKLARIMVDIPNDLDDLWTLDIKKSHATPPVEVKKSLLTIVEKLAEKSKRTWICRGKKEVDDKIEHLWMRIKMRDGSVLYQINREHPFVIQLINKDINLKRQLELLLKQIERNIPLNQIYVDLNNDEKFENETALSENSVKEILDEMLLNLTKSSDRKTVIARIRYIEPFCNYPNIFQGLNG